MVLQGRCFVQRIQQQMKKILLHFKIIQSHVSVLLRQFLIGQISRLAYEQSCLFSFTISFIMSFITPWKGEKKSHFFNDCNRHGGSQFLKNCLKLHYKRHCERYWERQKASFAKMWHIVHPGIGLFTIMICNIAERQMSIIFCYGTIQTDFLLTYIEWA